MRMHIANQSPDKANKDLNPEVESIHDLIPIKDILTPSQELIMAKCNHAYDQRCEKILALRTELLMRRQTEDSAYMMAILSPSAGEGRSRLAAELAMAFAKLNRPTLLVDADFRNPTQHTLFGTDNSGGLSQMIEADVVPDIYGVKNLSHLLVMTTGEIPENPLELLSSNKFAMMIEYLRDNFEFVIFDTAPVTKFSDALVIADLVSNVLTLSRSKRTSYRRMREMLRRLSSTNCKLLGGVINHF